MRTAYSLIAPLLLLALPCLVQAHDMAEGRHLLGMGFSQHWGEDANLARGTLLRRLDSQPAGLEPLAEFGVARHRLRGEGEHMLGLSTRLLLRHNQYGRRMFFELGSGPIHYTADSLGTTRWASRWQFRSSAGVGLRLDVRHELNLVYRASHSSNGGFRSPNPGLDEHGLTLEWVFR